MIHETAPFVPFGEMAALYIADQSINQTLTMNRRTSTKRGFTLAWLTNLEIEALLSPVNGVDDSLESELFVLTLGILKRLVKRL
uniref:Uncharacterized protein n=1 Tax=Romanomermis culicivorax TaxID=13658 RepID=A0A915HPR9_ROMCU